MQQWILNPLFYLAKGALVDGLLTAKGPSYPLGNEGLTPGHHPPPPPRATGRDGQPLLSRTLRAHGVNFYEHEC
jgi:hypothetical protein